MRQSGTDSSRTSYPPWAWTWPLPLVRPTSPSWGTTPTAISSPRSIHAAKIEVNEQGTEAAAATVVEAVGGSAAPPETGVTLIFDRPFLYGIVDLQTGVPLFFRDV